MFYLSQIKSLLTFLILPLALDAVENVLNKSKLICWNTFPSIKSLDNKLWKPSSSVLGPIFVGLWPLWSVKKCSLECWCWFSTDQYLMKQLHLKINMIWNRDLRKHWCQSNLYILSKQLLFYKFWDFFFRLYYNNLFKTMQRYNFRSLKLMSHSILHYLWSAG